MSSFFICLIIPTLILGPFFPDLIVSLSSIIFLIFLYRAKLFYYFTKKPLIIFFIFCIYCISVSIFVAQETLLSLESSLFYFRIGVFACVIWYLIENNIKILNYFFYTLVFCFSALVVDGFYQYFNGYNILGFESSGPRISSFFGDELIMGSYLARLFPLLFALFVIREKNKYELYYIGILFILTDILIYISSERTAFFFLNLSTIFMIILIKKYQKFRLITFFVALIFITFVTLSNNTVKHRMLHQTFEPMGFIKNSSIDSNKIYIFSKHHDRIIRTGLNMFLDKPIFGHGPKMFRVMCKNEKYAFKEDSCATHPHNFYVQLLAETGMIGLFFLLSVLVYVIYCSLRQLKSIIFNKKRFLTDYQVCLLAGILITVWPLSPNGNFFNNWLSICYSFPFGFYLHSIYGKNRIKVLK